jgi:chaperone required for assembly of F1-ATPase
MRDIFDNIYANQPLDPNEAARRSMRPALRKRFFKAAAAGEGNAVLLDGRPVRTPARKTLAAPNADLAQALADEWNAQKDVIDPAAMPLTRLANAVIDGVASAPAAVADEVAKYLGSDLVFYRAGEPAGLVARQAELWNPLLGFARDDLGARFVLAEGVVPQAQPPEAIAAARQAIPNDPWRLGAVSSLTTLTGSALIALVLARGRIDADTAWRAAYVDEDWNMAAWGKDEEALARRAARRAEFDAAVKVLELARQ